MFGGTQLWCFTSYIRRKKSFKSTYVHRVIWFVQIVADCFLTLSIVCLDFTSKSPPNSFKILDILLEIQAHINLFCRLQEMGLEKGWGDTANHVLEMIHLLLDILQAPDPSTLETFLGRIPMVFNVVILSPHGYFGQANVLGLPDTGGQVSTIFRCNWVFLFY